MAKSKEQESPITKKDYSRLAFEMLGGGLAGGLIAYSFDAGIASSATLVSGSVAALRVTINLLADLDPLLARLERVASSSRSKKGEVGAIFAPTQEETPKKGDIRLMPINGVDYEFPESGSLFPSALPSLPFFKPVSHSTTTKKIDVLMIEGDCSPPDSADYKHGQVPIKLLRRLLREADPPPLRGKRVKDSGQLLGYNTLVKLEKRYSAPDYHLMLNTLHATGQATGIELVEDTANFWTRLKFPWHYVYQSVIHYLKHKQGHVIPGWPLPPLPRVR